MTKQPTHSEKTEKITESLAQTGLPQVISSGGGCIHNSSVWQYPSRDRFFVKRGGGEKKDMLIAEARALRELRKSKTVRVPEVILEAEHGDEFFLVLEHLELQRLSGKSAAHLGETLAQLHRYEGTPFGFEADNYIGATPQENSQTENWTEFFWEYRLVPQFELSERQGYGVFCGNKFEIGYKRLMDSYLPKASLLHGDLWGGNAGGLSTGEGVVYDPASYYGDRETDLAFTEVFGGFPRDFYEAYQTAHPFDEGYSERKIVYNLYHYLNHLNLFGSGYLGSCEQAIRSIEMRGL